MKQFPVTFLFCVVSVFVYGQKFLIAKDIQSVFTLGEVVVRGTKPKELNANIGAARMQQFGKNDVAKALNMLPGVNLSAVGPRNEAMVYVRGFDLRQVPLLIDVSRFTYPMMAMLTWHGLQPSTRLASNMRQTE